MLITHQEATKRRFRSPPTVENIGKPPKTSRMGNGAPVNGSQPKAPLQCCRRAGGASRRIPMARSRFFQPDDALQRERHQAPTPAKPRTARCNIEQRQRVEFRPACRPTCRSRYFIPEADPVFGRFPLPPHPKPNRHSGGNPTLNSWVSETVQLLGCAASGDHGATPPGTGGVGAKGGGQALWPAASASWSASSSSIIRRRCGRQRAPPGLRPRARSSA